MVKRYLDALLKTVKAKCDCPLLEAKLAEHLKALPKNLVDGTGIFAGLGDGKLLKKAHVDELVQYLVKAYHSKGGASRKTKTRGQSGGTVLPGAFFGQDESANYTASSSAGLNSWNATGELSIAPGVDGDAILFGETVDVAHGVALNGIQQSGGGSRRGEMPKMALTLIRSFLGDDMKVQKEALLAIQAVVAEEVNNLLIKLLKNNKGRIITQARLDKVLKTSLGDLFNA